MNQAFAVDQSQPLDLLQVSFFWLNAGSDVSIFLPILTIWDLSSFLCVQDSFSFFSEVLLTFHLIISLTGSSFALSSSFISQYSKKLSKVFLIVLFWPTTTITKQIVTIIYKKMIQPLGVIFYDQGSPTQALGVRGQNFFIIIILGQ